MIPWASAHSYVAVAARNIIGTTSSLVSPSGLSFFYPLSSIRHVCAHMVGSREMQSIRGPGPSTRRLCTRHLSNYGQDDQVAHTP